LNAVAEIQPVFRPKILTTLKDYTFRLFASDAVSGVIVGVVALPLAIAFAIASGVTPDRGLVTAIVAGFLISALGGSRVQIGGPTGAYVVIVAHIVDKYGVDGLILCTLMGGVLLVAMGALRLGTIIKFIPYPLTVGFTAGIAVVIFSSQVKDFLGLKVDHVPADFVEKWGAYFHAFPTVDPTTVLLSIATLAILILWPRVNKRIPASIVALLAVTAAAQVFHLPVETIGSRFGSLPSGLPKPHWPSFTFEELRGLIGPAFTVAILGAVESLLSATVADGMIEGRHRSNTELIAQGIANIAAPLFGGIPATGAIARTATNVRNGGRTPVAGIIHALTLLGIMLAFGAWARMIPLCALAATLVLVSYHMSEWHSFRALLKAPRMDIIVLVTTFLLTVFVDLTVAVEAGMLLSVVLFIKRMTDVTSVRQVAQEMGDGWEEGEPEPAPFADVTGRDRKIPQGVEVFEAEGAFFFGVAEMLRDMLGRGVAKSAKVFILKMRHVLALDASGIRALSDLRRQCQKRGMALLLSGIHSQPFIALEQSGLLNEFGEENVLGTFGEALTRAERLLAPSSNHS
jgi:sulfate permease, SulP family